MSDHPSELDALPLADLLAAWDEGHDVAQASHARAGKSIYLSETGQTGTRGQASGGRATQTACGATHDTGTVTLTCGRPTGHQGSHFDGRHWLGWGWNAPARYGDSGCGSLREDGRMTDDWTTARVVRDRDGDLWGCDTPGPKAYWTGSEIEVSSDRLDEWYGPLTPVLDADGLPVVRTVGDLTARHIGREVHVEGMPRAVLLAMRQPLPDEQLVALLVRVNGDITSTDYLTLDTPVEVLS